MRRTSVAAAVLMAAGVGCRILLWHTQPIVSVDGVTFIRMAKSIGGGAGVESVQTYGFPMLIWVVQKLVADWVAAARGVALVFGVLGLPLLWWAGIPFFRDRRLALIPLAGMALHPLPVRYSLTTMTETSYLFFLLAMFGLAARNRRFPAGIAAGLAYTIRPEALLAAAAVSALPWPGRGRWARFGAGVLLVVAPYVIAQGVLLGKWTLSDKTINVSETTWQGAEARVGEAGVSPGIVERARRYGGETLGAYPGHTWSVAKQLVVQSGGAALVLAPSGLAGGAWMWLSGLLILGFLPLSFVGERARFFLPPLPSLWVLAALGVERWGRRGRRWKLAGAVLLVVSIGVSAFAQREWYSRQEDGDFPELVAAGKALAKGVGPDTVVFDRKPYVAFYAGARGSYVPTGTYNDVIDHVVAAKGDYLVVNSWVAEHFRPELLPLVTDPEFILAERRLSPVFHSISPRGQRTLIYRVIRPGGPSPMPGEDRVRASILTIAP